VQFFSIFTAKDYWESTGMKFILYISYVFLITNIVIMVFRNIILLNTVFTILIFS